MLVTYLNTTTREWFDADGNPFSAQMPEMAYLSRETVTVYLKKETPNAGELGVNPAEWAADTGLSLLPGIGACLTVDSDFTHKLKGSIAQAVTAGSGAVLANIGNAKKELIPQSGTLRLFDATGNSESVRYKSRSEQGDKEFLFSLEDGSSVLNEYSPGSTVDFDQAPYAFVYYNPTTSNMSAGMFAFDLVLDSPRLRAEMDYSDRETLPVQGMELLFFTTDADGNQEPIKAFVLDSFTLTGTMGSLGSDAPVPDPLKNEIAAIVGSLLDNWEGGGGTGGGVPFTIMYGAQKADGTFEWVPAEYVTKENLGDTYELLIDSITHICFMNNADGTLTAPIRTRGNTGAPGADGYTPVKGTDYWTAVDKAEIKQYVDDAILNGEW